jgi:hypothetical protein
VDWLPAEGGELGDGAFYWMWLDETGEPEGEPEGPFETLEEACQAARKAMESGK